ncbi:tetratricopeptide repeat protein [Magnetococcus sp. PR-3]|uniref:tetratricopeptide repeat protein n=1 Tax=Magnetococcus sp. PR-3 TaxID=3120355 RepID=UPI002FCE16F4
MLHFARLFSVLLLLGLFSTAQAAITLEQLYEKGYAYQKGRGVDRDPLTARDYYMDAAKQGHWKSQYALGWMYLKGDGITQDSAKAKQWLSLAAKQGDGRAQYALGQLLIMAPEPLGDRTKGQAWIRRAAKTGHAQAQFRLGMMYLQGDGVDVDSALAWKWLSKAEQSGMHKATKLLSNFNRFTIARAKGQLKRRNQTSVPVEQQIKAPTANPVTTPLQEQKTTQNITYMVTPGPGGDSTRSVRLIYDATTGEPLTIYARPKASDQGPIIPWNRRLSHLQRSYDTVLEDPAADPRPAQNIRRIHQSLLYSNDEKATIEAVELAILTLESGGVFDPGWLATLTPEMRPDLERVDIDHALRELTELESPAAHYVYGMRLLARHEQQQAIYHLEQSAELGFVHAQHALFEFYSNPAPNQGDPQQARYWGEQSASLGLVKTQIMLGFSLLSGSQLTQDTEAGLHWLHQATKPFQKTTVWSWTLNPAGHTFLESEPLLKQTINWLRKNRYGKVKAANLLLAQFINRAYTKNLEDTLSEIVDQAAGQPGIITSRFTFVRKLDDFINAVWRAHHDDPVAKNEAMRLYKQVTTYAFPEAFLAELLDNAINDESEAQTRLAFMHLMGLGVELNRPKATYWFYRSARQGHTVEHATAQAYLSFLALQQTKNEAQWFRALQWMNRAKDWDYIAAIQHLARFGFGKQVRALKLPTPSRKELSGPFTNRTQTFRAGLLHLPPFNLNQDPLKGVNLIQLAASAQEPAALFFLGQLHLEGAHVPQNLEKATELQLQAVELGYSAAPISYTGLSIELLGSPL